MFRGPELTSTTQAWLESFVGSELSSTSPHWMKSIPALIYLTEKRLREKHRDREHLEDILQRGGARELLNRAEADIEALTEDLKKLREYEEAGDGH